MFSSAAFASQAATGGSSSSSSKSNAAASISAALVLVLVVGTVGVALKRSRNKQNSSGDASALKEPFESPTVVGAAADDGAAQDAPECFEEREFVQSDSGGIGIKSVRRPNPAYRVSTIDTEGGKLDSATTL